MTIPCKDCITMPICKHKVTVTCPLLMKYIYKKEIVGDKLVSVSYTKFIEAQQVLLKMEKILTGKPRLFRG